MPKFKFPLDFSVPNMRIKYKDIFDMKEFYETLHEWLLEYGWRDWEEKDTKFKDHWESFYYEKMDRSGAKEIWIRWRVFKNAEGTKAFRYFLDLDFHNVGLMPTEIIRGGKKIKVDKGELDLYLKPALQTVYKQEFTKQGGFLNKILDLFTKRIYRRETEVRKKELYQEAYTLQNFIKQWFKLKRYLPYEETKEFSPSKAWPSHIKE